MTVEVGAILYGFCNGYFGRDSYGEKAVEAIGSNWVVVKDEDGNILFASFLSRDEMYHLLSLWSRDMQIGDDEWPV